MNENDVAKHYIGKKYIHYGDQIILMKSGKALIYLPFQEPPFQEPTHQYFVKLFLYYSHLGLGMGTIPH